LCTKPTSYALKALCGLRVRSAGGSRLRPSALRMRQEVGEDEGEVVEREAGGAAQGADDGTLLLTRLPGQLMGARRAILAVGGAALAPLTDGLGGDAVGAPPTP